MANWVAYLFFVLVGLLHLGLMVAARLPWSAMWVHGPWCVSSVDEMGALWCAAGLDVFHLACAGLAFYYPYMIARGYTHDGLGHASYGLLVAVIPTMPTRLWGAIFVLDKVLNYNTICFPGGRKMFEKRYPRDYWTNHSPDNSLVESWLIPRSLDGLAVNLVLLVILGALDYVLLLPTAAVVSYTILHVVALIKLYTPGALEVGLGL